MIHPVTDADTCVIRYEYPAHVSEKLNFRQTIMSRVRQSRGYDIIMSITGKQYYSRYITY